MCIISVNVKIVYETYSNNTHNNNKYIIENKTKLVLGTDCMRLLFDSFLALFLSAVRDCAVWPFFSGDVFVTAYTHTHTHGTT